MEKLGINVQILIMQLINFGILVFVLNKFLYKPLLSFLQKRQQKVAEGLSLTSEMEAEKEQLDKKREATLKKAREEASAILAEAKKQAKADKEASLKEARVEIGQLREKIEKDLKAKYEQMAEELNAQTVEVAAKMAEKVLSSVLSQNDHEKLIREQLKKMKQSYGRQ